RAPYQLGVGLIDPLHEGEHHVLFKAPFLPQLNVGEYKTPRPLHDACANATAILKLGRSLEKRTSAHDCHGRAAAHDRRSDHEAVRTTVTDELRDCELRLVVIDSVVDGLRILGLDGSHPIHESVLVTAGV